MCLSWQRAGTNSTFNSQLIIHLPSLNATGNTLEGKTVECVYNDGLRETIIDTHTIAYTREGIHFYAIVKISYKF